MISDSPAAAGAATRDDSVTLDAGAAGPLDLAQAHRERLGKLLDLTKDQEKRIKKFLKKNIEAWKQDTADLHDRLEDNNDLVEGVVEETDYPFEGASNIHVPVTAIYMKLFHAVERRSILGADVLWYSETPDANLMPVTREIDDMLNYKARAEWNVIPMLADVFWTTNRDGLGILKVPWVEDYETATDVLLITDEAEFLQEFPDAASAGLDEVAFDELLAKVKNTASMETPVEIPVTFEKLTYKGPKADVVELVDFVTFPATVQDIRSKQCKGYGNRYSIRAGSIKEKKRSKAWYAKAVDDLLKGKKDQQVSSFKRAQDEIEGLNRSDKDGHEFFEMAIRFELDKGEPEKKLLVTFSEDAEYLMAVMEYPYRVDYFALFRIGKRPNRLMGENIPDQTRDINDEIDLQHNQRVISRQISTVPSFKGKKSALGSFDPSAPENRWRPGVIFWLEDPESFEQFKVQPVDMGESLAEEKNDIGTLDLLLGSAASLLSGQASPSDPSAPGNKTAMMITQSNLRMDDPLATLREGVETLGEICLSHLYQFGPVILEYLADNGTGRPVPKTLHKKFLRGNLKQKMAGVTVVNNPEAEMQKWFNLFAQLMQEPTFAQNANARVEVLRKALSAGRVQNDSKILPSPQEIQQQQVAMQVEAMKQMAMEKAQAAMTARAEQAKAAMTDARNTLAKDRLAEQMAARALGGAMEATGQGPANGAA